MGVMEPGSLESLEHRGDLIDGCLEKRTHTKRKLNPKILKETVIV